MLDSVFSLAGMVAMAGWVLLLLFPRRDLVIRHVAGTAIPVVLSLAYAALIAAFWFSGKGGFGSLDDVALLFQTRGLLLAGWLHYLAFDLAIGAWQAREAKRAGMAWWLLPPCFLLTFLFGPIGLLLFLGLRAAHARRLAWSPA